jgi:hypothetical protein
MTYSNRNEAINYVITSPLIESAIVNICPIKYREDFRSHFYLQILEIKNNKLEKAFNDGYIDWLCIRIMSNQLNSNTSTFWKLYRNNGSYSDFTDSIEDLYSEGVMQHKSGNEEYDEEYDSIVEDRIKLIKDLLTDRHWYHTELFKLHLDGLSYKEIEKKTKINYQNIRLSILQTKEFIKNKLNTNGNNNTNN